MTWEEIKKEYEQREEEIQELVKKLVDGQVTFKHSHRLQEGFMYPCSDKFHKFQFTYFDERGAVGDFRRNTVEALAKSIMEYGFVAMKLEEANILR